MLNFGGALAPGNSSSSLFPQQFMLPYTSALSRPLNPFMMRPNLSELNDPNKFQFKLNPPVPGTKLINSDQCTPDSNSLTSSSIFQANLAAAAVAAATACGLPFPPNFNSFMDESPQNLNKYLNSSNMTDGRTNSELRKTHEPTKDSVSSGVSEAKRMRLQDPNGDQGVLDQNPSKFLLLIEIPITVMYHSIYSARLINH